MTDLRREAAEELLAQIFEHACWSMPNAACESHDCRQERLAAISAFALRQRAEALRELADDWIGDVAFHQSVGNVDPVPFAAWLRKRAIAKGTQESDR